MHPHDYCHYLADSSSSFQDTIRVSESESPRFLATQSSGVTNSTEKEIPVLLPEGILNVGTKIDETHSVVTSYQCTMLP